MYVIFPEHVHCTRLRQGMGGGRKRPCVLLSIKKKKKKDYPALKLQSAANLWGYIEKAITLFTLQNCSFLHYFSRWHWTAWRSKYIRLQIILKLYWQ